MGRRAAIASIFPRARTMMPLVISFHGFRSNAAQQEQLTSFSALADREKFIAAYPEGIDDKWRFAGRTDADVKFTLAIIEDVAAKASLDRRQIYANGISNGAEMSWRLACDAPRSSPPLALWPAPIWKFVFRHRGRR